MYLKALPAVSAAIVNVNTHGGSSIDISLRYSDFDIFVTVSDDDDGFDVKETIRKFKNSERYYNLYGQGFISMNESSARIGLNEKGNKTFIAYQIKNPEDKSEVLKAVQKYRKLEKYFRK